MKNKKLKSISYKLTVAFLIVILVVIAFIWVLQAIMLKTSYSWFREKQIKNVAYEIENFINKGIQNDEIDKLSIKNDCVIYILDDSMNYLYTSNQYDDTQPKGLQKEINKAIQEVKTEEVNKNILLSKTQIEYNIYGKKKR